MYFSGYFWSSHAVVDMAKSSKKDLFSDLELNDDTMRGHLVPLSKGGPGVDTLRGCKDILMKSTKLTLVSST